MNNLCVALFPCMNLRTEIELLKQQLSEGNATITELQQQLLNANRRIAELEKKNEELERRLLAYENAHTPPSALRRHKKRDEEGGNGGNPGRKPGHEGVTRPTPTPDDTIEVKLDRCPICGSSKLNDAVKVEKRVIEDIPKPQPVRVTEYRLHHYDCESCGAHLRASHPDCPAEGRFGRNAQAHITLLKYRGRAPHRRVCELLETQHGLKISPATAFDVTFRASKALNRAYGAIVERARNSKVVYVDETGMRVNGTKYWIWVFTTERDTVVVVRHSRGSNVLVEVLGMDYGGFIVCDGWSAYPMFTKRLQRCWAHALREAKHIAVRHEEAIPMRRAMKKLFSKLKENVHEALPPPERRRLWSRAYGVLHYWSVRKEYAEKAVRKFANKMKNGLKHFLTFVLHPEVEPTNNRAEQALREHDVVRKIIGTLRNEKGTRIHEIIMSVFATWLQRGANLHEMLVRRLAGS
jgi:transposase